MPEGNRMGPLGQGPITGSGMVRCRGANTSFNTRIGAPQYGTGHGGGHGGSFRHRHRYSATGLPGCQRVEMGQLVVTKKQKLEALKMQAERCEQALGDLRNKISEVESSSDESKTP